MILRADNFKELEKLDYDNLKKKLLHDYLDEYNVFNHMYGMSGMLTSLAYGPIFKARLQEANEIEKGEKSLSDVVDVYLAINRGDILSSKFDIIYNIAQVAAENGHKVNVCIDDNIFLLSNDMPANYTFTSEQMERLEKLNDLLTSLGQDELVFNEVINPYSEEDYQKFWTFKQVKLANDKLSNVVSYVKYNNYSPFEAMLFFHKFATERFVYKGGNIESERVVVGAFNKEEINCGGFASIIKALVDKFDSQDLKSEIMPCEIRSKSIRAGGGHCQNLIYLKDDDYDIDGYYIEDASRDSKPDAEAESLGYGCCLVPAKDFKHLRGQYYLQEFRADRFQSLFIDIDGMLKTKSIYDKSKTLFKLAKIYRAISSQPEVIAKYGERSLPIPLTSYKRALTKIYHNALEEEYQELAPFKSDEDILKSSIFNAINFDRRAKNCFSTNARQTLDRKKIHEYQKMADKKSKGDKEL